jgi:hypothetical protein
VPTLQPEAVDVFLNRDLNLLVREQSRISWTSSYKSAPQGFETASIMSNFFPDLWAAGRRTGYGRSVEA